MAITISEISLESQQLENGDDTSRATVTITGTAPDSGWHRIRIYCNEPSIWVSQGSVQLVELEPDAALEVSFEIHAFGAEAGQTGISIYVDKCTFANSKSGSKYINVVEG